MSLVQPGVCCTAFSPLHHALLLSDYDVGIYTGDLEVDMLWSGMAVEQVVQEGGFRLPRAASWRMHALSPGTPPRSSAFYSSKVCPSAVLLHARDLPFVLLSVLCGT